MSNLLDRMIHLNTVIRNFLSVVFQIRRRVSLRFSLESIGPSRGLKGRNLLENLIQNQGSIAWVEDRLSCDSYMGKNGQPIFRFKNYLVKYIHSIDPNFQASGIDKALYVTSGPKLSRAFIYTNTQEAAHEIKKILHDKNVSDIFPGII